MRWFFPVSFSAIGNKNIIKVYSLLGLGVFSGLFGHGGLRPCQELTLCSGFMDCSFLDFPQLRPVSPHLTGLLGVVDPSFWVQKPAVALVEPRVGQNCSYPLIFRIVSDLLSFLGDFFSSCLRPPPKKSRIGAPLPGM